MKADDKVAILQASPPASVLESTRRDFQAILSSAYSSAEESGAHGSKLARKSPHRKLGKHKKHNKSREKVELVDMTPAPDSTSASYSNSAFWYERENSASSTPTHSFKSQSSKRQMDDVRSRSSRQSESESSVKKHHDVIVHDNNQTSSEASSSEEDDENESEMAKSPPIHESSPSVSSSTSKRSSYSRKPLLISSHHAAKSSSSSDSKSPIRRSIPPSRDESRSSSSSQRRKETPKKKNNNLIACSTLKVIVHQTDRLFLDQPQAQPMVIVHAVNGETGRYLFHKDVPIPPQFTGALAQREPSPAMIAVWNQSLVFEFDTSSCLNSVLLLFQLVSEQNLLAWGFLRPVSRFGVKHTDKKVQLQLFRVPIRRLFQASKPNVSDIFSWFQNPRKEKYPATLYVTIAPVGAPSAENNVHHGIALISEANILSHQTRLRGQPFKFPTRRAFTLNSLTGAMMARYSPDGSSLAVALTNGDIFVVLAGYSDPTQLKGHQGNVYDLDWSIADDPAGPRLLSCGADASARVWDKSNCLVLPHPAYVYSARFLNDNRIATGCYDQLLRLWEINTNTSVTLIESYTQHTAPINCLSWDPQGLLYSGDAIGSLCIWNVNISQLKFERYNEI